MGKFSLVYVLGLSLIAAYGLYTINARGSSALDTYSMYYGTTMSHNIALAGANIGTQMLLFGMDSTNDLVDQTFCGGSFDLHIMKMGDSASVLATSVIEVGGGDVRDTVIAGFRHIRFSKFGWFTEAEKNGYVGSPFYGASDWKITGDSVFGQAHTNGHFNLGGTPFFNDKVTATSGPASMTVGGVYDPVFKAGYDWGINIGRTIANLTDIDSIAQGTASVIDDTSDVSMQFINDGTVHVKIPPATGVLRDDTVDVHTLAPNGVVVVKDGDLRITGTYSGQLTVTALKGSQSNKGNVWIDGDGIFAADDPRYNPDSQDMLGIVSEGSTFITRDDSRTPSSNVTIEATVYCYNGELTAQDFWQLGLQGRVTLYGGVTQKTAGSLGVFSGGGLIHGMFYSVYHDPRFNFTAPPHFPVSSKFELVTWWEN